jgi:hypothetical protein
MNNKKIPLCFIFTLKVIIFVLFLLFIPITPSFAENCKIHNLNELFKEDYDHGTKWASQGQKKIIKWSATASHINDENVIKNFSDLEKSWIREAILSWDMAVDSIIFEESLDENADLKIGWVLLNESFAAYWNAWWTADNIRYKATIKMRSEEKFLNTKNGFIYVLQHELGNVLGLGDIEPSLNFNSVLEDPWVPPYGNTLLSDFDYGLIRQLYGENVCPSSWKDKNLPILKKPISMSKSISNFTKTSTINIKYPVGYKKIKN